MSALIQRLIDDGLRRVAAWQARWPHVDADATLHVDDARAVNVIAELMSRLEENYPFGNAAYAGQMLKPPHEIASIAYFLTQQINPNNHALDGGPATARMEREVVTDLARMFGYDPATSLGHLTSSGTIANLEALWVSRQLHPEKAIAYSAEAHYTHSRMCEVLGVRGVEIAADAAGRMNLDDLQRVLRDDSIGTVVATAGTTSLGMVDPIPEIVALSRQHRFRVHVDSAYGGFFRLLAGKEIRSLAPRVAAAFREIAECDSVVIDPHKHGLQPYGCGCVLLRDASLARFYLHDSPYTYFTSDDLHLGEISLECSRAGAAAAALWATLQCFPLRSERGLGPILTKTRAAAVTWAELICGGPEFRLVAEPELDIIAFYPIPVDGERRVSKISAMVHRLFERGMSDAAEPYFLAKLHVKPERLAGDTELIWDEPTVSVLRSVLMKPEHLDLVPTLHRRIVAASSLDAYGT